MAITINGTANTITGLAAGGLPDDSVTTADVNFSPGKILQVVACPKTDHVTLTTPDATWNDITGVDQAGSGSVWCCKITPAAITSKILVLWDISICMDGDGNIYHGVRIVRDSTAIHQGPASHASTARATAESNAGQSKGSQIGGTFLDTPFSSGSPSEVTYKIQAYWHNHGVSINAGGTTSNDNYDISSTSNLTLMEIAG